MLWKNLVLVTTGLHIEKEDLRDARITAMCSSGASSFLNLWNNGDTAGIRKEVRDLCESYYELGVEHGIRDKRT